MEQNATDQSSPARVEELKNLITRLVEQQVPFTAHVNINLTYLPKALQSAPMYQPDVALGGASLNGGVTLAPPVPQGTQFNLPTSEAWPEDTGNLPSPASLPRQNRWGRSARVKEWDIATIIQMYEAGQHLHTIAAKVGCTVLVASRIIRGHSFAERSEKYRKLPVPEAISKKQGGLGKARG